ncbi:unnamed protein product [Arctia plantaginis]|uniref:Uncharacterized protein n=1 Tax=Arctia plantaginis TaxID=874455 RepID=A0A8S0Z7G7_ARCPL|nr:unnamed protein product [Arctia plantaginis]
MLCKTTSPSQSTRKPVTVYTILEEIQDMKRQLVCLPAVVDDIRTIKVKSACEFASNELDEFETRPLENLQEIVKSMQREVEMSQIELLFQEQIRIPLE